MDNWYALVNTLRDESEDPYLTQQFAYEVFSDLVKRRIKEKGKFKNRMGPEFETWIAFMEQTFPVELVKTIIQDDDFWELTLSLTIGV